jgi:NAD(P)-dependent dehydrogenase (short-subunit alcohol dehydrogenase family)
MTAAKQQQVALVTGGTRGIGAAVSHALADEDWHKVIGVNGSAAGQESTGARWQRQLVW